MNSSFPDCTIRFAHLDALPIVSHHVLHRVEILGLARLGVLERTEEVLESASTLRRALSRSTVVCSRLPYLRSISLETASSATCSFVLRPRMFSRMSIGTSSAMSTSSASPEHRFQPPSLGPVPNPLPSASPARGTRRRRRRAPAPCRMCSLGSHTEDYRTSRSSSSS